MALPNWLEDAYKEPGNELAHVGRNALRKRFRNARPEEVEAFLSGIHSYGLHRDSKRPRYR